MRRALVILVVLLAGVPALAQPPPNQQRREQIKQKIRTLRAYALTSELNLDEKTGGKLWPVLARYDDELDKLLQQRVDLQRRLSAAGQVQDPKLLDRLVDEAIANQKGFWSVEERRLAELRKILTPAQTARLLVVFPAFERRIQNQLRRAIAQPRRPAGPATQLDEDEDDDPVEDEPPRRKRDLPGPPRR
jgi:hypothetical protein